MITPFGNNYYSSNLTNLLIAAKKNNPIISSNPFSPNASSGISSGGSNHVAQQTSAMSANNRVLLAMTDSLSSLQTLARSSYNNLFANATSLFTSDQNPIAVNQLAQGEIIASNAVASTTAALGLSGTFSINGVTISANANDSLQNIASLINAANTGTTASINSQNQLIIASNQTGASATIQTADLTGSGAIGFTSSNPSVATTGTLDANTNWSDTLSVNQLATNEIVTGTKNFTNTTSALNIAGSFTLDDHTFNVVATDSLNNIVSMINSAGIGVTASINSSGAMTLVSNSTGAANAISASDATTTTKYALQSDNTSIIQGAYDTSTTVGQWQVSVNALAQPSTTTNDTNYASDPTDSNWATVASDQVAATATVNGTSQTVQELNGLPAALQEYGTMDTANTALGANAQPSELSVSYMNNGASVGGSSSYSGEMTLYGSTAISDSNNAIASFFENQYGYLMFKTAGGAFVKTGIDLPTSGFSQINMYFNWTNQTVQYSVNGKMVNGGTAYAFQTAQTSINAFAIHNNTGDATGQVAEFSDLTSTQNASNLSYSVNGGSTQTNTTNYGSVASGINFQAVGTGTTTLRNVYEGPLLQYLGLAGSSDTLNVTQAAQNATYTVNGNSATSGTNTVTLSNNGTTQGTVTLTGTGTTTIANSNGEGVLAGLNIVNASGSPENVLQQAQNASYTVGTTNATSSTNNVWIGGQMVSLSSTTGNGFQTTNTTLDQNVQSMVSDYNKMIDFLNNNQAYINPTIKNQLTQIFSSQSSNLQASGLNIYNDGTVSVNPSLLNQNTETTQMLNTIVNNLLTQYNQIYSADFGNNANPNTLQTDYPNQTSLFSAQY